MTPWRDDPDERRLAELLDAARTVPEGSPQAHQATLRRLQQTLAARSPRPRVWQVALPALAAFALTVLLLPRLLGRFEGPAPAPVARVQAAAPAPPVASSGIQKLETGTTEVASGGRVRTPQVEVWVEAGHCRIQVAGEHTEIEVLDGAARVYREGSLVQVVHAGTRVSFDAHPAPSAPSAPDACAPLPQPDARRTCYAQAAVGTGLEAQNALFALGQLDLAAGRLSASVQSFRTYMSRYPDGALWPEAAAGMLSAHLQQHAWPQALEATELYLTHAPSAARAPEVRLIRANLLRQHTARLDGALQAYQALVQGDVPASVRSEALFGLALTARRLGRAELERSALESYAREFPEGPHAADVAAMRRP